MTHSVSDGADFWYALWWKENSATHGIPHHTLFRMDEAGERQSAAQEFIKDKASYEYLSIFRESRTFFHEAVPVYATGSGTSFCTVQFHVKAIQGLQGS